MPETFSYTLSEAWCFCIPPAARRLGALAERIQSRVDGFLFDVRDEAAIDFLLWADRERQELRQVARRLRSVAVRSVQDAVIDYYRLRADYFPLIQRSLESQLAYLQDRDA